MRSSGEKEPSKAKAGPAQWGAKDNTPRVCQQVGDGVEVWDGHRSEAGWFGNNILLKGCQCPASAGLDCGWHTRVYQYPKGIESCFSQWGPGDPSGSAISEPGAGLIYVISWRFWLDLLFEHHSTGLRLDGARALASHISEGRLGTALRIELKKSFGARAHGAGGTSGASDADGTDGALTTVSSCLGGKLKQRKCP